MYQQIYDPIANNLVLSAVVALIPIIVVFVLLAGIRMAAQRASLITLATALVIAVVYGMPVGLGLNSTLLGICFSLFPIVWIVINATFPNYKFTRVPI
jgi:lactate permease